jgi:hypothetical protein
MSLVSDGRALSRVQDLSNAYTWLSNFRKFAEQFGDIIGRVTTPLMSAGVPRCALDDK